MSIKQATQPNYDANLGDLIEAGTERKIPVIMAPPGYGAGGAIFIPNLLTKGSSSTSRKRGYTKPSPWPSK